MAAMNAVNARMTPFAVLLGGEALPVTASWRRSPSSGIEHARGTTWQVGISASTSSGRT